jgi:hypothetical protein
MRSVNGYYVLISIKANVAVYVFYGIIGFCIIPIIPEKPIENPMRKFMISLHIAAKTHNPAISCIKGNVIDHFLLWEYGNIYI